MVSEFWISLATPVGGLNMDNNKMFLSGVDIKIQWKFNTHSQVEKANIPTSCQESH